MKKLQIKRTGLLLKPFLTEMMLSGKKTQTRRTKGLEKINQSPGQWIFCGRLMGKDPRHEIFRFSNPTTNEVVDLSSPYGLRNDQIYIKEGVYLHAGWIKGVNDELLSPGVNLYYYDEPDQNKLEWIKKNFIHRPAIFMPKLAARHCFHLIAVRVERLHDIGPEDVINEGIDIRINTPGNRLTPFTITELFKELWDSMEFKNPNDQWGHNPWVFVYEFIKIDIIKNK